MKKVFGFVAKNAEERDPATGASSLEKELTLIQGLAEPVVEALSKVDFDGDGKVAAYDEIVQTAERYGLKKLRNLAGAVILDKLDNDELKRWLVLARVAASLAHTIGVPHYRYLELAVSAATALTLPAPQG